MPAQASAPHPNPLPAQERGEGTREVALFADTFNTYFEPENLYAALDVLTHLGYRVSVLQAVTPNGTVGSARPLCCGRTSLGSIAHCASASLTRFIW